MGRNLSFLFDDMWSVVYMYTDIVHYLIWNVSIYRQAYFKHVYVP